MRAPVIAACLLLAGCVSAPPQPAPASRPELPGFTTTAGPVPSAQAGLASGCAEVAARTRPAEALPVHIPGGTSAVTGVPQPSIGRLTRLDCYFGVSGGDLPGAALIVTLTTYTDAAAALDRVERTTADDRAAGALAVPVEIGAARGYYVESTTRAVVVASGPSTVVVRATPATVPGDASAVLSEIARRVLG